MTEPIWSPSKERVEAANMTGFLRENGFSTYREAWEWSVAHPEQFWPRMWEFSGLIGDKWDDVVIGLDRMAPPDHELGPRWFTGSRLNFAENLLRYRDDGDAIVAWNESGRQRAISWRELHDEVARVAAALRERGVRAGDRVAGFLPNIPEGIVAM